MFATLMNFVLIILLLAVSFFDVTMKRIPNFLTFPAILIGLILNVFMNNLNGLIFSFFGFFIGLAVFFIPFAVGLMGAGDVKLMAAIGALMGWKFIILSTLFSAIAGIFVTIIYLVYKKKVLSYFRKYFVVISRLILKYIYFSERNFLGNKLRRFAYSRENESKRNEKLYVPYGLSIAVGTLIVLSEIFNEYLIF